MDESCFEADSSFKGSFILSGFHCTWRMGTKANSLNTTGNLAILMIQDSQDKLLIESSA